MSYIWDVESYSNTKFCMMRAWSGLSRLNTLKIWKMFAEVNKSLQKFLKLYNMRRMRGMNDRREQ